MTRKREPGDYAGFPEDEEDESESDDDEEEYIQEEDINKINQLDLSKFPIVIIGPNVPIIRPQDRRLSKLILNGEMTPQEKPLFKWFNKRSMSEQALNVLGEVQKDTTRKYGYEISLYIKFLAKIGKKAVEFNGSTMAAFLTERKSKSNGGQMVVKSLENIKYALSAANEIVAQYRYNDIEDDQEKDASIEKAKIIPNMAVFQSTLNRMRDANNADIRERFLDRSIEEDKEMQRGLTNKFQTMFAELRGTGSTHMNMSDQLKNLERRMESS